ncbi:MAG: insulinase family protein [Acidobacteria bacterium]|nr:insulinase family protein [Acidobacteriota bacterium]
MTRLSPALVRRVVARSAAVLLASVLLSVPGIDARQLPDRGTPPAPGAPPSLRLPPIERRTLPNGLQVWIVEMHEVPVVHLTAIVKSGAAADPAGRYGLAHFTAAMLDEGAGNYDALQLADAIDFLGASLSTAAGFDSSLVNLHTPASKLSQALPLLADTVLRPRFADGDLERVRKERLTSLVQTRDNPAALASAAFARLVFGPEHRYGTLTMGTQASNTAITAADLRTFHGAHYRPQNTILLVAGDVRPAELMPQLDRTFGTWSGGAAVARPTLPAVAKPAARQIYLVDKPGAAQSQIRIGGIGVARSTPDYFPLRVMNTMLGGSFSSRLNQNLREAHGYTYGASSMFDMRATAGPFVAGAGVQTDKTVESLREFFNELNGMREPTPPAELTRVRNLEALSFPGEFETTSDMTQRLTELAVYDLAPSFFTEFVPKIEAVGPEDIGRVVRQHITPDTFAVVIVGDLSKIEQPVRDANLGPVRIVPLTSILD